ncbi:hypothetical protein CFS9_39370 [Flavobacterium sp. CFS9]|uniref:DinB superfamily protein n=1 Tax=Flavobacterium sp. CFS9 TaxID=3143118 RepID=A0AAT9H750_9FLAO
MTTEELISFFERDLDKLISEIELYKEEENIWKVERSISNPAGNLALHLVGNLNEFIGKYIGHTNYIRDRDLEFAQKNVARTKIIEMIKDTQKMIRTSISMLSKEELEKDYPILKFSESCTTEYLLVHLMTHLTYHLGQINYHRRLIEK